MAIVVVMKSTDVPNFAMAEMGLVAAYVAWFLAAGGSNEMNLFVGEITSPGWPFAIAIILGVAVCGRVRSGDPVLPRSPADRVVEPTPGRTVFRGLGLGLDQPVPQEGPAGFIDWIPGLGGGYPWAVAVILAILTVPLTYFDDGEVGEEAHGHRPLPLLLLTIGLTFALGSLIENMWGATPQRFESPWSGETFDVGDTRIGWDQVISISMGFAIALGLAVFFRSKWGVRMRAIAEDGSTARMLGISAGKISLLAWAIGSLVAGAAMILNTSSTVLELGSAEGLILKGFIAAVLGGFVSLPGTFAGGLLVGVAEAVAGGQISTSLQPTMALLIVWSRAARRSRRLESPSQAEGGLTWQPRETTESGYPLYPARPEGWRRHKTVLSTVLVFAFLAILPWFPVFDFVGINIFDTSNDFGAGNMAFVFAFAAAAVGFNLLIGYSGTLGLAHAGSFALGAYGTAILSAPQGVPRASVTPSSERPCRLRVAVPVDGSRRCVAAAIIGIVVGFPAARLKGFFLAIATLALGELIVTIIRLDDDVWSGLKTNGGTGKQVQIFRLFGAGQVRSAYFLALIALLITFIGYVILTERRLGRTLKTVRDIEIATGPIGISATYYKLVAFGLAAFAASLAGAAWAQNSAFVNPQSFRTRLLVFLLVVLIVGGLGRLWGPLIGALFFVYIRQELQDTQKLLFLLIGIALMLSV